MNAYESSPALHHSRQRFGNYTLIKTLGQGGFAEVYLGRHIYLHTMAAVKILHPRLNSSERAGFFAEARLAAQLRHPHIVRVLEFDIERQIPFLVMDYASGGTVRQRYPRGAQPAAHVILSYVQQAASALQYIHDQGLIHRDVKPENLLLGSNGELLLSDFGIAIAVQHTTGQQASIGTVAYMAPEQLKGYASRASDQYALGVMVYEWLCGAKPFRGSVMEVMQQHLSAMPPSLCERVPGLAPAIENVVLQALAKDSQDRFESVQAFSEALHAAFACEPPAMKKNARHFPVNWDGQGERDQKQVRSESSQQRNVWKEIATFYAIDLLAGAVLSCVLYGLSVAPTLVELYPTLGMMAFPLLGALMRRNLPLFFLSWSIAVVAALLALLLHALIFFPVTYIGLLLLSLLIAFAVSINDI